MSAAHPHHHSHDEHHDHAHAHPHVHAPPSSSVVRGGFTAGEARQARRLGLVLALVGAFFVLELGGALWADSVVLQADAFHLLMDVLALGVSLFAMRLAVRRPTPRFTFGLRRAEPVAALFSAMLVLGTAIGIIVEGVEALHGTTPPRAGIMLVVAVMALFVNGISAWLLHDAIGHSHPHAHDPDNPDDHTGDDDPAPSPAPSSSPSKAHGHALNLRGAWLHLAGDTLGAIAAIVAAVILRLGGPASADPIASFVVAGILLFGVVRLFRDASLVLLESAPAHLPLDSVRQVILSFPGVVSMHDLHVWTLGAGHEAVSVHVRTDATDPTLGQRLSEKVRSALGVEYVTVQVEVDGERCSAGG